MSDLRDTSASAPGAGQRPRPATSLVRLEGRGAAALLHRISTRFLSDLEPGRARMAPFCEFRGRLLHRAAVAMTRDGALWLLRDDGPGEALAAFIERHLFREEVRLSDVSTSHRVRGVPGGRGLSPGTLEERAGVPIVVQPAADFAYVLEPPGGAADLGDERGRICQGWPRHGHEIVESFTPFEVGLGHEVHLAKGCFTGQEALMRLVNYDSVRRRLARLSGAGNSPGVSCDVRADGVVAGTLTSICTDEGDRWVGLAVLKHEACASGARLEIEGVSAVAPAEPFPLTSPLGLPGERGVGPA